MEDQSEERAMSALLHELRVEGVATIKRLSTCECETLDESFRRCRKSLSACVWKYYRTRSNDVDDATSWLGSETYAYAIDCVIAGKRAIPISERDWLAIAKTIRHRYYASREIVVDGGKALFMGENDTNIRTRVEADRLQLDDVAFINVLIDYATAGLGRSVAPAWVVETVIHWVTAPEVSWRDRAAELGVSRETVKSREAKCKAAVRAGIMGDVVAIAD